MAQYQWQIEAAQTEIGQRRAEQAQLKAQSAVISERLAGISQEKIALEAERTAKSRAGQEMNETLLNLERAASRLETKLTTSAMEEKQILDKLWETYELNHSDAQAQRIELESVPKASRRVAELKREINGLGTINVGAIDEFERVNGRYTYLTDQRNDVEKAKGELTGIIGEITSQMTDIFGQQFKLLSESFEQTFVELFGGGQAKLELEDPEHILDCGIEIKAQPPGKVLKTISLLSGGEKVRCMLSRMMLSGANVILLDQPTNHLDLESIAALNNGLEAFKYNIIFASHDHQLTQTVANRIIEITDDGVIDRMCTFDEYMNLTGGTIPER